VFTENSLAISGIFSGISFGKVLLIEVYF